MTGNEDGATLMQWRRDGIHLKVLAGIRIERMERNHKGYRSLA